MRPHTCLLFAVLLAGGTVSACADSLFDRVVVFGASVSAAEKAPSPGWLLARHMGTPEGEIFAFARGGADSEFLRPYLANIEALRPTLVVAVDLFFHDFRFSLFLPEGQKQYLRDYIARLHGTGAVVVLGNIPPQVLLRHEHVNRYLESLQPEFPRLVLIDLDGAMHRLEKEGIRVRNQGKEIVLRKDDIFADRVHPNEVGSTLLANMILETLETRFPDHIPVAAGDGDGQRRSIPLPLPSDF